MASSRHVQQARRQRATGSGRRWSFLLPTVVLVALLAGSLAVALRGRASDPTQRPLGPHEVVYRYRFGGEVITHYLPDVIAVTIYRTPTVIDEVVFNLASGHDYVLNADVLVDYRLPSGWTIEQREMLNQLYYHYDPYLQGEKQELHRQWTNEQYLRWAGRPATDEEWLEVLNELTRGVDHRQMGRWIQYSPPAIARFVRERFTALMGRQPTEGEFAHFYRRLLDGAGYEAVEREIAAEKRR